jgi:hypothetical protein
LHSLLTSRFVKRCLLPGLRLWLRFRWAVLILLGLSSAGYAFSLVRAPENIDHALFYWFIYSGGALIAAGLIEQGNNLARRG